MPPRWGLSVSGAGRFYKDSAPTELANLLTAPASIFPLACPAETCFTGATQNQPRTGHGPAGASFRPQSSDRDPARLWRNSDEAPRHPSARSGERPAHPAATGLPDPRGSVMECAATRRFGSNGQDAPPRQTSSPLTTASRPHPKRCCAPHSMTLARLPKRHHTQLMP